MSCRLLSRHSVRTSWEFSLEHFSTYQVTYLLRGRMKVTHLMSMLPNMQEARERFNKISAGHFVWCRVFLQCSEIESGCFEIFQSQFGHPQISPFNFLSCSACWSKKQDAGMLTSNANSSSPTMSHALEQTKAARIGVICLSASSKLSASCLHGYSVSIRKIHVFCSGRRYSQHPRLSRP